MKAKAEGKAAAAAPAQAPVQWLQLWQLQMDAGLRAMSAMFESAGRLRDAQLPAMSESMARFAALQKELLAAKSPWEFWNCQCTWMLENGVRALGFWKDTVEAATVGLATGAREGIERPIGEATVHAPAPASDLVRTALVGFDAAYGEMLKGSQQMMAAATEAMNAGLAAWSPPGTRQPAA